MKLILFTQSNSWWTENNPIRDVMAEPDCVNSRLQFLWQSKRCPVLGFAFHTRGVLAFANLCIFLGTITGLYSFFQTFLLNWGQFWIWHRKVHSSIHSCIRCFASVIIIHFCTSDTKDFSCVPGQLWRRKCSKFWIQGGVPTHWRLELNAKIWGRCVKMTWNNNKQLLCLPLADSKPDTREHWACKLTPWLQEMSLCRLLPWYQKCRAGLRLYFFGWYANLYYLMPSSWMHQAAKIHPYWLQ